MILGTRSGETRKAMQPTATPESVGLGTKRLERIRPWMQACVNAGKLPRRQRSRRARRRSGVGRDGRLRRMSSSNGPSETGHLMRFYSMTKPVTSVAAMMLYEQGLFQLDDPVSRFLPALEDMQVYVSDEGEGMRSEPARRPVTIHHLLTHTAGFTYGLDNDHPVSRLYRERHTDFYPADGPLHEVIARLALLPLVHHPGEHWNYGVSTDVLGHLVEVVSGQRLDRFFAEHILEAASHGRHVLPGAAREARAPGPPLRSVEDRRPHPPRAARSESLL